jgi:hypothetical protein
MKRGATSVESPSILPAFSVSTYEALDSEGESLDRAPIGDKKMFVNDAQIQPERFGVASE